MSELKRCRARLVTFKGFTPATEAELALPMYMAAVLLDEDIEPSRERLEKAIARLKDTSKLKAKCVEMMSALAPGRGQVPGSESDAISTPSVMSSVVERSALPLGLSKTSHEISPCASLSRDDNEG